MPISITDPSSNGVFAWSFLAVGQKKYSAYFYLNDLSKIDVQLTVYNQIDQVLQDDRRSITISGDGLTVVKRELGNKDRCKY